ncbi:MAG: alpha/beta fold hydrolase [Chloroflexi bacterium]|nr:MAG: alpha/beta fold hydrolase [Chloroflexota bacterium]
MEYLRTADERFKDLPGYDYQPQYVDVPSGDGDTLRVHYIDEGARGVPPVLMLHGEPSWCYLYRKMVPVFVAAGYRAVAPDLIGFGRSDKPVNREDYTYHRHVDWIRSLVEQLDLSDITLFGQDWGGLIGLRLAAEDPDRFARIVAANTFLPTGDRPPGEAFLRWQQYSQETPNFHVGGIIRGGCATQLSSEVIEAYNAPFPDDSYKAGARQFPMLVPVRPDDPASEANRRAWQVLGKWEKPFLCAFSDSDPVTRGADELFKRMVPGTNGQPHTTIKGGGHFLQEDKGEELAHVILGWLKP